MLMPTGLWFLIWQPVGTSRSGGRLKPLSLLSRAVLLTLMSCFHSLKSVERSDAGRYWCQVEDGSETETSQPVWLTVEGEEACGHVGCLLVTTPLEKKTQWKKATSLPFGA